MKEEGRLTFKHVATHWFNQRGQTHVLLSREAVTVQRLWPGVPLTGQHGGTAIPHGHTQATAWLNEPVEHKKPWLLSGQMLISKCGDRRQKRSEMLAWKVECTYVSKHTGAMREQRKALAWGWHPVCSSGRQSSERGTTSPSRLLCPSKLGSLISE